MTSEEIATIEDLFEWVREHAVHHSLPHKFGRLMNELEEIAHGQGIDRDEPREMRVIRAQMSSDEMPDAPGVLVMFRARGEIYGCIAFILADYETQAFTEVGRLKPEEVLGPAQIN